MSRAIGGQSLPMNTTNRLDVDIIESASGVIVRLKGDAGVSSADILDRHLLGLTAKHPPLVVFDLAELHFISSLGLGMLMQFQRGLARHSGVMRLAAVHDQVLDMLRKCRLDSVFVIRATLSEALEESRE